MFRNLNVRFVCVDELLHFETDFKSIPKFIRNKQVQQSCNHFVITYIARYRAENAASFISFIVEMRPLSR